MIRRHSHRLFKREIRSKADIIDYYFKQGFFLVKLQKTGDTKAAVEPEWQLKPRPTKEEVKEWILDGYGIGVALGQKSDNLIAVDPDNPDLYEKLWPKPDWEKKTMVILTSKIKVGNKEKQKRQIFFKASPCPRTKNFRSQGIEMELRGEGGYSALPPTIHPKTLEPYQFENSLDTDVMIWKGNFQEWFLKLMEEQLKYKPEIEQLRVEDLFLPRSEGERHYWQIRIVTWLKKCETDQKTAWEKVVEWNETNIPPIPSGELEHQFNDVWDKPLTLIHFDRPPAEYFNKETMDAAEKALEEKPLQAIVDAVEELHVGDNAIVTVDYFSALSAKISMTQINTWGIGRSQIGKSHEKKSVIKAVLPKGYAEIYTSCSPVSFFYAIKAYGENFYDGKLIYIDEVESSSETMPMLRSLTGQTDIEPRHLSVHDAELLDLKIKGKRVIWFTSIRALGGDQMANRFFFENPDESEEQNVRIWKQQNESFIENTKADKAKMDKAKAITVLIVQNTKDKDVVLSYGIEWPFKRYRYLFPIFVSMVKICAKVHYKRRKTDEEGNIISEIEDFEIVKGLWHAMEKEILYRVNKSCQEILNILPTARDDNFTVAYIASKLGRSTEFVRMHLSTLSESDLINCDRIEGSKTWVYWLATLPKIEDINATKKGVQRTLGERNADLEPSSGTEKPYEHHRTSWRGT
jgi:hypothetical protein